MLAENEALEATTPETPESTTPQPETTQQTTETQVSKQETVADRNYRALVEKTRKLERERDEALRLAHEAKSTQEPEKELELSIGNDEIVEGKHIKEVQKELKRLREEVKQYKQNSAVMSEEALLRSQYPDIDKVVSKENIDLLRASDPEFVEMLEASTNFKAKAVSAYKQIKKLGIYTEETSPTDKEIALRNSTKPKPLASISQGDSPLSRANAFASGPLTEDMKKEYLKEMNAAIRNH